MREHEAVEGAAGHVVAVRGKVQGKSHSSELICILLCCTSFFVYLLKFFFVGGDKIV